MAKYQLDWVKIVDFSLIASYLSGWTFFWIWSQCILVISCESTNMWYFIHADSKSIVFVSEKRKKIRGFEKARLSVKFFP